MRKLSKILVPAMLVASLLGVSGTASAQSWNDRSNSDGRHSESGYSDGRHNQGRYSDRRDNMDRSQLIRRQIDELHRRIDSGDRRNYIPERQAVALRSRLRTINRQFVAFSRDGLNQRELRSLENQINSVRIGLHMEQIDLDGRRR